MFGSNITGRLLNARRILNERHQECIEGDIYEDVMARFHDGARIVTSPITLEDGPIICTRHSIYEVEGWAEGHGSKEGS